MFCIQCGTELPKDAVFCSNCGRQLKKATGTASARGAKTASEQGAQKAQQAQQTQQAQFVPARCTACNAILEVDPNKDAAICPFCGTPYIVSKAIHNYTENNSFNSTYNNTYNTYNNTSFHMGGTENIPNLLKRAKEFEDAEDLEKAIEYYNHILDINIDEKGAREGLARIEKISELYNYFKLPATHKTENVEGTLMLKRGKIVFRCPRFTETYLLKDITEVLGGTSSISLRGEGIYRTYYFKEDGTNYRLIVIDAKNGHYPLMEFKTYQELALEDYIRSHFNGVKPKEVREATALYAEKMKCSEEQAKKAVQKIFAGV